MLNFELLSRKISEQLPGGHLKSLSVSGLPSWRPTGDDHHVSVELWLQAVKWAVVTLHTIEPTLPPTNSNRVKTCFIDSLVNIF